MQKPHPIGSQQQAVESGLSRLPQSCSVATLPNPEAEVLPGLSVWQNKGCSDRCSWRDRGTFQESTCSGDALDSGDIGLFPVVFAQTLHFFAADVPSRSRILACGKPSSGRPFRKLLAQARSEHDPALCRAFSVAGPVGASSSQQSAAPMQG